MSMLYSRYIDNKFMMWEGKYNEFKNEIKFLRELTNKATDYKVQF